MKSTNTNIKNYQFSFLTVISIFAMGQIAGSIDAAISKIATAFSLSSTTGLYVSTVSALSCVVFSFVVGFIAGKKVSHKVILYFSAIMVLVGGILPFFAESFSMLLILRVLFGIGFGGMMSLENTFVSLTIPAEKRASVLGIATFVGFGTNCLLQFIGGILADISWSYVFLNHLLLIIPFLIILFCCPDLPKESPSKEKNEKETTAAFTPVIWGMWSLMFIVGLLISPLLIGCSFLSENIYNSATVAGIVAVCFSIGCMIGGLLYFFLLKKLGKYCFTVFLLIGAIGILGSALARNIPILCFMILLGGIGFSTTQATSMMTVGLKTSTKNVGMASAIMMSLFNLGMFLSSYFQAIVEFFSGDALYTPLYIGASIFVFSALILALRSPLKNPFNPALSSTKEDAPSIVKNSVITISRESSQ